MTRKIQLLNPVTVNSGEAVSMSLRGRENLNGTTVGIIHSFVPYRGFEVLQEKLSARLSEKYGVMIKNYSSPGTHTQGPQETTFRDQIYDTLASEVDSAIVGTAFCGSCSFHATVVAVELTRRGIPNILATKKNFETLVMATSKVKGVKVNMLVLPDTINSLSNEEFDELINNKWDEIENGLCGRDH